jgi:hypothetical protein
MSAPGKSIEERLHFIKHKGHAIYVIDFSHCTTKEMLLLLDMVRADIARHEPHSMLTLADFTGAEVDKTVATRIKEVLVLDRPYVKRSAFCRNGKFATYFLRALQELLAARPAYFQDARGSDGVVDQRIVICSFSS